MGRVPGRAGSGAASATLDLDVRADNVLLTEDGVCFTDWPWAATGAPWFDLIAFLPSVAMQIKRIYETRRTPPAAS